jgi:hypothetical protein
MKKVLVADSLPQGMQEELASMIHAMEKKYGKAAVTVGMHVENLSTLVTMIASDDLEDRAGAVKAASRICNEVICSLGMALDANPEHVFAVAEALQEQTRHLNAELLGEQPHAAAVTAEADAAIARARVIH